MPARFTLDNAQIYFEVFANCPQGMTSPEIQLKQVQVNLGACSGSVDFAAAVLAFLPVLSLLSNALLGSGSTLGNAINFGPANAEIISKINGQLPADPS